MPGLFGIYETSRRSLLAYQSAIQTAGHNVANAATPGFHRQRVDFSATAPITDFFGTVGTGVGVSGIRRIENRFLSQGIQREMPVLSAYLARADVLGQAESAFGEPSEGGLTTLLDDFYQGWDDLATNPEDAGVRESVVRLGVTLADTVRTARRRLESQMAGVDGEIRSALDDANRVMRQLAALNRRILVSEAGGVVPADLEDQRDSLTGRLAELTGATSVVDSDGTATVWISERVVVQREVVQEISSDGGRNSPLRIAGRPLDPRATSGRVGGLVAARDDDLAGAIRNLDEFAARLVKDVNAVHRSGVDRAGRPAGVFFTLAAVGPDGIDGAAQRLGVSGQLLADADLVSAGRTSAPGDNGTALDIAALRNQADGASGILQAAVVSLGSRSRESQDLLEAQSIVVDSYIAQREAVSGVSLDEEAAMLLRFQRSYEAAARVLTIADELTRTILSL